MNPVILYKNLFLEGTPTATDTATGYDVLNIRDWKTFTAWKSTGYGTKYLRANCNKWKAADTIAFGPGHNLYTARALVSVEYSYNGSTWTEILAPFLVWSDRSFMRRFPSTTAYDWRVKIVTGSVAAYVPICVLGEGLLFPSPPGTPYRPVSSSVEAESAKSKSGQHLESIIRFQPFTITPEWTVIARSWLEESYQPFHENHASSLKPFFWAWDLDEYPLDVRYVKPSDDYEYNPPVSVLAYYDSFRLPMEGVVETGSVCPEDYFDGLMCSFPLDDINSPLAFYGQGAPTFTRATAAWYKHPFTGLITEAGVNELRIEAEGALIEGQRTNLLLWSRDMTNAVWNKSNMTAALDQIGEDGVTNSASSLLATAADATCLQSATSASAAHSGSISIKRITGTGTVLIRLEDLGTWIDVTNLLSTTGWYRALRENVTTVNPYFGIRINTPGDKVAVDYAGVEPATFCSSRIPTTSAAVTRNANELPVPSSGNLINTVGTLAVTFDTIVGSGATRIVSGYNAGGIYLAINGVTLASWDMSLWRNSNLSYTSGNSVKAAVRWFGSATGWSKDGVLSAAGGFDGDMGLGAGVRIGNDYNQGNPDATQVYGHVKHLLIFNRALTDAEMQAITAA